MSYSRIEKDPRDIFWLDDPTVLYSNNNYIRFVPSPKMTRTEQLNALTRFSIYLTLLIILFGKAKEWLIAPVGLFIFVVIIYNICNLDKLSKQKEANRFNNELFDAEGDGKPDDETEYSIEAGYYDSNGKLRTGKYLGPETKRVMAPKPDYEKFEKYTKATCRLPTENNPFMNPAITDFNNGDAPAACNADDDEVKEIIDTKFNEGLYRDIDDLFNIKNSQRQFYTVPVTSTPPDTVEFANWLYNTPKTTVCKETTPEGQSNCLRYEDIRLRR
jgi:hypothetical protein